MPRGFHDETDFVVELASWHKKDFERAVRSGKLAFLGRMFGCECRAFTNRVKRRRGMNIRMARASLKHSQETLAALQEQGE